MASKACDEFVATMAKCGLVLPVCVTDEDIGVVLDAEDGEVCTVDASGSLRDDQVAAIASAIVLAINSFAGFEAALVQRRCRVCGCTQLNACPGRCWWVESDLCSTCADAKAEPTDAL